MNPLISEISQNLPQPSDFGVGGVEYNKWEGEIESLKKIPAEYKHNYTGNFLGTVVIIAGLALFDLTGGWSVLLIPFGFGLLVGGAESKYTVKYTEVISHIRELESKKNTTDSKYRSAKREKREYIDGVLNQYKDTYLYRKRSDSYGFAEKLQIYSDASEHFSDGDYLDYFNDHRKYVNSRDIKVMPYKRPVQQNLNKSVVTNDTFSVLSNQATNVIKQNSIKPEDLELVLENVAVDIPPQQVGKQINSRNNFSSFNIQSQEKLNMVIGDMGEEAVANYEKKQFQKSGRNHLAERVEIVSKTIGDGLGYDVLSFDQYGNEKFIEVKTTRSDSSTANFSFTRGELNFLTRNPDTAFVYCVFGVNQNNPRLKIYSAKQFLNKSFEPVEYRASV
jgi:hypothetical protein